MRLIINADDLGRTREVNEAIFALMDRGLVTSATLMANSPWLAEALAELPRFPRCSFGIHLNLTEFPPLTHQPDLDSLLDQDGNLNLGRFRQAVFRKPLIQAILGEWSSQISKLRSAGLTISHIDSHHGTHTVGQLFWALKRLQRQYGIRKVRIRENIARAPGPLLIRARIWNLALRLVFPTRTTSGFTDFSTFLQVAPSLRGRFPTLEVMVHPGHPRFAEETGRLLSPWREQLGFPVQLISFHEL
jgi:chitin disaccharide deacetylase